MVVEAPSYLAALQSFSTYEARFETLRLNFSNRPPLAIAEGMARLGACVRARLREAGPERQVAG